MGDGDGPPDSLGRTPVAAPLRTRRGAHADLSHPPAPAPARRRRGPVSRPARGDVLRAGPDVPDAATPCRSLCRWIAGPGPAARRPGFAPPSQLPAVRDRLLRDVESGRGRGPLQPALRGARE